MLSQNPKVRKSVEDVSTRGIIIENMRGKEVIYDWRV